MSGEHTEERTDPHLDALIQACVPESTASPDWDDVCRRANELPNGTTRGTRTPRVIWLAAAAILIAVVTLAAVVRNTSPKPVDSSAPQIAPARVDWGMTATVTVKPDPGVAADDARDRLTRALLARAAEQDIAGFEATPTSDTTIRIRVPAAETEDQLRGLIRFERVEVIDPSVSVRATSDSLEELGAIARRLPAPNGRMTYWRSISSNPLFGAEAYPTAAEARKRRPPTRHDPGSPVPIPSHFRVAAMITGERDATYALVAAERLVHSGDVENIEIDGNRVVMRLSPAAASRVTAAPSILAMTRRGDDALTILHDEVDHDGDRLSITLPTALAAKRWSPDAGSPGVTGEPRITSTMPYGTRPRPVGVPFTPTMSADTPRPLNPYLRNPGASWIRTPLPTDAVAGPESFLVVGSTPTTVPGMLVLANSTGYPIVGASECARGLGAPVVEVCSAQPSAPETNRVTYLGRTAANVDRVTIRFPSGASIDGPARDGWFALSGPVTNPADRNVDPVFIAHTANGIAFEGAPPSVDAPFSNVSLPQITELRALGQRPMQPMNPTMTTDGRTP